MSQRSLPLVRSGLVLAWRPWLPFALLASVFLVVKLVMSLVMNPIGDEAYYWLWGQHLALSYFDHPPLHAWLLHVMELLFGWNLVGLRLLTWITMAASASVFWSWAGRLDPPDRTGCFWRMMCLYLASPLFFGMTSIAFNDHLMIALCLGSAHFMLRFTERWEAGEPRYGALYLAAVLLGLAVLTKYNAVFLGLGYATFVIVRPALRPLLLSPHTYAAALLSIAMQAPVFAWNLAQGMASYRFHLAERWTGPLQLSWQAPLLFAVVALIVISPFAALAVLRYIRSAPPNAFARRAQQLAVAVFAVSTIAMLALASFAEVFFYWNIVAFLLVLPLSVGVFGRGLLFGLHVCYGAAMALLMVFSQSVSPLGNLFGAYDWTISSTYGWEQIGRQVQAARTRHGASFVGTTFYTTAAQLGFAIADADVVAISPRPDQFDVWSTPDRHLGEDAVIVADPYYDISYAAQHFESVEPIEQVQVMSFGRLIYAPTLYLARRYRGLPEQ